MPRIALGVEYLGYAYCGWQKQKDCLGVQAYLEKALSKIACQSVEVFCAGRTDKGVHGLGQVVHFDVDCTRPSDAWVKGTNCHLPPDIRVTWSQEVGQDFHARFSAVGRRYRYVLLNRQMSASAVFHAQQTWHAHSLDVALMQQAADYLLGEHDFSSFRAAECQAKHPVRTMHSVQISRYGDLVFFDLEANAFLHHMVRNIVGSLLKVGQGLKPVEWMSELLQLRDRTKAAATAPAAGLYLTHIRYPEPYLFPQVNMANLWHHEAS